MKRKHEYNRDRRLNKGLNRLNKFYDYVASNHGNGET